jgi:alpha/beta superfamily hydrolase
MQRFRAVVVGLVPSLLFVILCIAFASADRSSVNIEATVCGWLKERAAFAAWSMAAGRPNPNAWRSVAGSSPLSHKTRDGRMLHGYKISRPQTAPTGSGFVLVAQGNAMLADQLLHDLGTLAGRGKDVYIYDYRGYGNSEGKRRLKAIVSDYREIFDTLSANPNDQKLLYGISFGGIVLLNVIGGGAKFHRAVIDSSPSHISHLGCPTEYDPVRNLPPDSSALMIISGNNDTVVTPQDMRELISTAKSRGAQTVVSDEFAHPFMDTEQTVHEHRAKMIKNFLFEPGR